MADIEWSDVGVELGGREDIRPGLLVSEPMVLVGVDPAVAIGVAGHLALGGTPEAALADFGSRM